MDHAEMFLASMNHERPHGFITVSLDVGIGWPSQNRTIQFGGKQFEMRPKTAEQPPNVLMKLDGDLLEIDCYRLLKRFLSSLAWVNGGKVLERFSVRCSAPMNVGGYGESSYTSDYPIEYLPDPSEMKARLALALYREAISSNILPYECLGYFKILNILHLSGKAQVAWMNDNLQFIRNRDAQERCKVIADRFGNTGEYLYTSRRCAIAHAFSSPLVNPDEPTDLIRLKSDLPLIRALAELAIEKDFGVKSLPSIEREHLYELEGFRAIIGEQNVRALKTRTEIPKQSLAIPSKLTLTIRGKPIYDTFRNLNTTVADTREGVVLLHLQDDEKKIECLIELNFAEERLTFDVCNDCRCKDDGSSIDARRLLDAEMFFRDWISNGVVEVWSDQQRLGRSQPTLLCNVMPDWDLIDKRIETLRARAYS